MTKETGFILTARSLDKGGNCELQFYCRGGGGPFLIRITNHKPLFFIDRSVPSDITAGMVRRQLQLKSFSGGDVDGIYFNSLRAFFDGRSYLQQSAVRLYESDIRAEDRFLMERFINCGVTVDGKAENRGGLREYLNPAIAPAGFRPELKLLSFDIETGRDGSIYSAAFHLSGKDTDEKLVLMRGAAQEPARPGTARRRGS